MQLLVHALNSKALDLMISNLKLSLKSTEKQWVWPIQSLDLNQI